MTAYEVTVVRSGAWWDVLVPKIEGLTQTRRLGEAELMARELIALETAQPIGDIDVCIQVCLDSGGRSLSHRVDRVRQDLAAIASAQAAAEAELEQIAREMAGAEISLREIGEFLGVAPQRVRRWVSA
ncbi:hypothetical protein [Rhodococcus koreensis]|uniref:Uncharacterized protein n=1 Tax=Rhodococcus koreensis TaxID=99653 RepID=A0A1H4IGS4_9NOCA|nr:hypothetical protein [Rhodococcus koreensis]SEB33180.1 hypothetical protein SAMN04490239_0668 [Rhodococcus koreensis]